MNTTPSLSIRMARGTAGVIEITRSEDVPNSEWMMIHAQFGTGGQHPAWSVEVPAGRFMRNVQGLRHWSLPGIQFDPQVQEWLRARAGDHQDLAACHTATAPNLNEVDFGDFLGMSVLKPFQRRDLQCLLKAPHGLNFSVPGAGKTRVALANFEVRRQLGEVTQMLVIAPHSAFESWQSEARAAFSCPPSVAVHGEWNGGHTEVLLCAYARLGRHAHSLHEFIARGPTFLVFDEAHRAKRGENGQWGAACLALAQSAHRRLVLTGTPAPQGIADLRTCVELAHPGMGELVLPPSVTQVGQAAGAMRGRFVRTTKSDLDLPRLSVEIRNVPMAPLHQEIYRALRGHVQREVNNGTRMDLARLGKYSMSLLIAATNPALLRPGATRDEPVEFELPSVPAPSGSTLEALLARLPDYEVPAKYAAIAEHVRINSEAGRKTIIWSNFVRNLTSLKLLLKRLQPAMVHGKIPLRNSGHGPTRQEEIDRFRRDPACRVLIANPATLGEGISLHETSQDAIYLDRTFNAGSFLQSVDRIHRLGLRDDATPRATIFVSPNTIDEVVALRVGYKVAQMARLLDDRALNDLTIPDEPEPHTVMSADDATALLLHLSGRDTPES